LLTRHALPRSFATQALDRHVSATDASVCLQDLFRNVMVWVLMGAVLLLGACSSTGGRVSGMDAEMGDPQAVMSLEEHLAQAARAESTGDRERARGLYRQASKAYPVAEEPWRKLAESYFNVGDYGNAIQASQEVMQRNPKDPVAASVLAISGLRLSTQALSILRDQADAQRARLSNGGRPLTKSAIIVAARLEAETLARNLRDVLGEPVLVPSEAPAAGPSQNSRPRPRPAAPTNSPPPAKGNQPTASAGNPFDKLK
jgi:hypothetical protein